MSSAESTLNSRGSKVTAIVIGGGIAGLACARRLYEAGVPFRLITDRLGGRMFHRPGDSGSINFGATYISEDYERVLPFVKKGIELNVRDVTVYGGLPGEMKAPSRFGDMWRYHGMQRLMNSLVELRIEFQKFREQARTIPAAKLRYSFPLIDRYSRQCADEFIDELGVHDLSDRFLKHAFRATCFAEQSQTTALLYLGSLLPMLIRVWVADFTQTYARLTEEFVGSIQVGRVCELTRSGGLWAVSQADGQTAHAENVVIAVPYHNASQFYPIPPPAVVAPARVTTVRGRRLERFRDETFTVAADSHVGIDLVWRQHDQTDLVFSAQHSLDLSRFYSDAKTLETVDWKTAVVLSNGNWLPSELEHGVYFAGDYNLCGLEDSFISGECAANQIILHYAGRG